MSEEIKERVLVIDGFNLFYRNFSTYQSLNYDGEPNGGYIGFINQLKGFIEKFTPRYCFVVFDGAEAGYRRRQIFPGYKGKKARKKRFSYLKFDEEFKEAIDNEEEQIALIFETLKFLPVVVIQVDYYEADDIISYLISNFKNTENIICSSDQDYVQLVSDNTLIYSPTKNILFSKKNIGEYYGVLKENFLFYRTVIGDGSDKIKGVDGVGGKTILKLIPELRDKNIESIGNFLKLIENLEGKGSKINSLKESKELILMNYKISELNPISLSLKAKNNVELHLESEKNKLFKLMQLKIFFVKKKINHHIKNYDKWVKPFFFIRTQIEKIWN